MLALLSVLTVTAWLVSPTPSGSTYPSSLRWGVWGSAVVWAMWVIHVELRAVSIDLLHWDGHAWWWQRGLSDPVPCHVRVVADFGGWVLLRCTLPRTRQWRAFRRQPGASAQWHALRCALYAPRSQA